MFDYKPQNYLNMKYCPSCGKQADDSVAYCPSCGAAMEQRLSNPTSNRKPDNYLVWAILSTILCCLPLGVVSIIYSCKVNSLWEGRQEQEAYEAARKAKNWAIASAVSGVVFSILYVVAIVAFGFTMANTDLDLFDF